MSDYPIARSLDLSGECCPTNMVMTVQALKELAPGDLLEVTVQGEEAMNSVPRAVKQAGHAIVRVDRLDDERLKLIIRVVQ